MRSIPRRLWILVVVSALLQLLPFPLAGPVLEWRRAFSWICLSPWLLVLLSPKHAGERPLTIRQAIGLSYTCGVLWYAGNCYWIYQTMYLYGGIPKPLSAGILVLFSLYLGLYHALFGGLLAATNRLFSPKTGLIMAPFLWVAVELARARVTSFPWDLLGNTQVDNLTLTRLAPFTGVMGISFVVVMVNALWVVPYVIQRGRMTFAAPVIALLFTVTATSLIDAHKYGKTPSGSAVLLQENLGVGMESSGSHESKQQMLASFSELSEHPTQGNIDHPQIVIWPEAPTAFVDSDPQIHSAISELAQQTGASFVVNDVAFASQNENGRYNLYNSASFYKPDGTFGGRYDKIHLVPFGEYTPYKPLFFFVGHLLDDLPFIPGTSRTVFTADGKRYGVFICYESIFGDEIREFAKNGAQVLVNISDDGWYGDTSAPWEHLDMARMRAIENHRWLLRATNTGVTAAINPLGQITEELPRHIRGSLAVHFGYEDDLTLYTRFGDWFAWLCVLISGGGLAAALVRARFRPRPAVH